MIQQDKCYCLIRYLNTEKFYQWTLSLSLNIIGSFWAHISTGNRRLVYVIRNFQVEHVLKVCHPLIYVFYHLCSLQIVPLHLPPGDTSTERNVYIDGSNEHIELAKELINEVLSGVSYPFSIEFFVI